tara:strand:- start:520 stop:627 length:108 start_codon:yes stop_codon:yes gene_type:complete
MKLFTPFSIPVAGMKALPKQNEKNFLQKDSLASKK